MKRLALVLVLMGCVQAVPPQPAPQQPETSVAASFDETWNAVIDHFAGANIPIATIERASGIIATARLSVSREDAAGFADCGRPSTLSDNVYPATSVIYNVLVRGDDSRSSVRVTASWETSYPMAEFTCQTTGAWESGVEEAVKRSAETSP